MRFSLRLQLGALVLGFSLSLSLTLTQGCNKAVTQNGSYSKTVNVSWSENSVSVTEPTNDMLYQCNLGSRTYYMVAMLTMDA